MIAVVSPKIFVFLFSQKTNCDLMMLVNYHKFNQNKKYLHSRYLVSFSQEQNIRKEIRNPLTNLSSLDLEPQDLHLKLNNAHIKVSDPRGLSKRSKKYLYIEVFTINNKNSPDFFSKYPIIDLSRNCLHFFEN